MALTRRSLAALGAACALLALAAPRLAAQEDGSFLDAYKAGVEAVGAEDWPRAERLMRAAIAGRSAEAERLIRQFHLRPYLPHFYLGLALAEQGRCEAALAALAESERQGVVTGLAGEVAILREREAACRDRLATEVEARDRRQAVADLVARAERAAASIAELAGDPALAPGWERGEPSLAARLAEARETIATARDRLDGPEPDLAAATDLARGSLGQLEAIRRETDLRRQAVGEERRAAAARIAALGRTGRELVASTADLAATAPALARHRGALAEAAERAAAADAELPLPELRETAALLERRIGELRAAAAPPPAELVAAADAWLRGEPRVVLALLAGDGGDPPFQDPRARAHALLLRSAAAFTLHETAADAPGELLDAARQAAAECRRLDPDLVPIETAFPPRFRTFFATVTP